MKRNDIDICADLLKVAQAGAKKTHLVYKANLNFNIVKKYMKRLIGNKLLKEKDGIYWTTKKGEDFLIKYSELSKVM